MATSSLTSLLANLHGVVATETFSEAKAESVVNLLEDIAHVALKEVALDDVDYCVGLFLKENNGLIAIIRSLVGRKECQSAVADSLKFLHAFVEKVPSLASPFAKALRDLCWTAYVKDDSVKIRSAVFPLLIAVCEKLSQSQKSELDLQSLARRFYDDLPNKNIKSTVKHCLFAFLGFLSEHCSNVMIDRAEGLAERYLTTLKYQIESTASPDASVLSGCFRGLYHFLEKFDRSARPDQEKEILNAVVCATNKDLEERLNSYDVVKTALKLVTRHFGQFKSHLLEKRFLDLHGRLSFWGKHTNRDVRHDGLMALEAYMRTVSEILAEDGADVTLKAEIFRKYLRDFSNTMKDSSANAGDVARAVKGFGYLAMPCKKFLKDSEVQLMLDQMLDRSYQLCNSNDSAGSETWSLSNFLDAVANILTQLDKVSTNTADRIELVVVRSFFQYPMLMPKSREQSLSAVACIFVELSAKDTSYGTWLNRVVHQCLLHMCAYPPVTVPLTEITGAAVVSDAFKPTSCSDFVPVWKHLLNISPKSMQNRPPALLEHVKVLVYDELLRTILAVLKKLDLSATKPSADDNEKLNYAAVNVDDLRPVKAKDYQIMLNIVTIFTEIFSTHCVTFFNRWTFTFCYDIISLSTRCPLVSGFYKILSVCMTCCSNNGFFKVSPLSQMKMEADDGMPKTTDTKLILTLFAKYAKEVLVRIRLYKDELLATAIDFLLTLPVEIVRAEIVEISSAMKMALELGFGFLPMASRAIGVLKQWCDSLSYEVMEPCLRVVLPCLDGYLRLSDPSDTQKGGVEADNFMAARSRGRSLPKHLLRLGRTPFKSDQSQLNRLKIDILCLLASLGGEVSSFVVSDSSDLTYMVKWDTVQHLRFDLPFVDFKASIYLDLFLPLVSELALAAPERQTRVVACELLHAIVLYMLGRGSQRTPAIQQLYPMTKLYRNLLPVLLELATDVETVAKQLFEPLVLQVIHWFSGIQQYEHGETGVLLDAIMNGIVDPHKTSLRDFCARCLKEFITWSIKQTSKTHQDTKPHNIKSLLKRMYSLARHPGANMRLGAALTFNSIYTVFREEESLVDEFTLEILDTVVLSLAMTHGDDRNLGTQEEARKALQHLERIIREKAALFNRTSKTRRLPRSAGFEKGTLSEVVSWLLRQCGCIQTECRHACMGLVWTLSTCISGIKSCRDYFSNLLARDGFAGLIRNFEGQAFADGCEGIAFSPRIDGLLVIGDSRPAPKVVALWLDMLLAALDCYYWVFDTGLLTPTEVLKGSKANGAKLFESISYFTTHIATKELRDVASYVGSSYSVFTPKEVDLFNRAKCTVVVKMFDVLSTLVKTGISVIPNTLMTEARHWEILGRCVLTPTSIGFDVADTEVINNLPKLLSTVLRCYVDRLDEKVLQEGCLVLQAQISDSVRDLIELLPKNLLQMEASSIIYVQLLNGLQLLHSSRLLSRCWKRAPELHGPEDLARLLYESAVNISCKRENGRARLAEQSQNMITLGGSMLKLAISLGVPIQRIVDNITGSAPLSLLSPESEHTAAWAATACGANLYFTFGSVINEILLSELGGSVASLLAVSPDRCSMAFDVLQGLVEYLLTSKKMRDIHGKAVVAELIKNWPAVIRLCSGVFQVKSSLSVAPVLTFMKKMLSIDSQILSYNGAEEVRSTYLQLLVNPSAEQSMALKCEVLDLLMIFAACSDHWINKLGTSLERFVADNFPLYSRECAPGSPQYDDYVSALTKILVAMELTGSLIIFRIVVLLFCREAEHSMTKLVHDYFNRFIQRLTPDQQRLALSVPFEIFVDEKAYPQVVVRQAALVNVCIVMLQQVPRRVLGDFFVDHIVEIMGLLGSKQPRVPEVAFESSIIQKTCCFRLVEIMYSCLSKDDLFSPSSRISMKWKSDPSKQDSYKEMTKDITGWARDCKNEDMRGETVFLEQRRVLHCAAYNALIAIIVCTQTDIKFYNMFLFNDEPAKGQLQLDNIVDKCRNYKFELELSAAPKRRRQLVALRSSFTSLSSENDGRSQTITSRPKYINSQYLADSSLAEDMGRYDFSTSRVHPSSVIAEEDTDNDHNVIDSFSSSPAKDVDLQVMTSAVTIKDGFVELDEDEINSHECMATMTALLQHMHQRKISPDIVKAENVEDMPRWMAYIHGKLDSHTVHSNIKLFLVKLVVNNEEVFRPFAKQLFRPLVNFVSGGQNGGQGLHPLVVDVVLLLLSWPSDTITENTPGSRLLVGQLIEFLVQNVYYPRKDILRTNMQLLKVVVEQWKDLIVVPSRAIHDLLVYKSSGSPSDSLKYVAGIEVAAVFLGNGLATYFGSDVPCREKFYGDLARLMSHDHKSVYEPAAEVVGMALKFLSTSEMALGERFHQFVSNGLDTFGTENKSDKLIVCLHKIKLNYPLICDKYISKIFFLIPKIYGVYRFMALDVLLCRVHLIGAAFSELQAKDFLSMLSHRDDSIQLTALRIVKALLPKLLPQQLWVWLPAVSECTVSDRPAACRHQSCEIFMWIYDNYRNESDETGTKILGLTKRVLLQCLCDEDSAIRLIVQNFWTMSDRLPSTTPERLLAMLQSMYDPQTEARYLSGATGILLEMTSRSPDFNKELFEHPLSECQFHDYNVQASWQLRHATMAPLFADTLAEGIKSTLSLSNEVQQTVVVGPRSMEIRATVDAAQFAATQHGVDDGVAYDWVTQSMVDTFADATWAKQSFGPTTSLISASRLASGRLPNTKPGDFSRMRASDKAPDELDGKTGFVKPDLQSLRRRFLKDRDARSFYFAKRQVAFKAQKDVIARLQTEQRESTVVMYRKYRVGDLPDIQIKSSAIISPLQALATRDSTVAQLLMASIFRAVYGQLKLEKSQTLPDFISRASEALNSMLDASLQSFSPLVSFALEVSSYPTDPTAGQKLDDRASLTLRPATAAGSSERSGQPALGIVFLEENLLRRQRNAVLATAVPPPAKRAKKSLSAVNVAGSSAEERAAEIEAWVELAKLHKQINNYDVVSGIFSDKINSSTTTKKALEFESMSKYREAVRIYEEALSREDWQGSEPHSVEKDFWDEARFQCLEHLTEWKDMEEKLDANIGGSWSNIWQSPNRMYLPYVLRAKSKLLLAGDSEQKDLIKFFNESGRVKEFKDILEGDYSETLASIYAGQREWNMARHYASKALQRFMRDWASQSSLLPQSRVVRLQSLQQLIELRQFLGLVSDEESCDSGKAKVEEAIGIWKKALPSVHTDASGAWDDVVLNRCVFLDFLGHKIHNDDAYIQQQITMKLDQASIAIKQNNLGLAKKLLSRTQKVVLENNSPVCKARWNNCYGQLRLSQVAQENSTIDDVVERMRKTLQQCDCTGDGYLIQNEPLLVLQCSATVVQAFEKAACTLLENAALPPHVLMAAARKLGRASQEEATGSATLSIAAVVLKGYEHARKLEAIAEKADERAEMSPSTSSRAMACMKLAVYCDKFLRLHEQGGVESEVIDRQTIETFATSFTRSLLRAMKYDSSEARQWFPRLLQLLESHSDPCSSVFVEEVKDVPTWMFLKWLGQMLSVIDQSETTVVWPVLKRVAQEYPQALVYPFNLSSQKYHEEKPSTEGCHDLLQFLKNQLDRLHLVKQFMSSLECFAQPEAIFESWYLEILEYFDDKSTFKVNAKRCFQKMYFQLLQVPSQRVAARDSSLDSAINMGSLVSQSPYFRKFAEVFKRKIDDAFGSDGSKLLSMEKQAFRDVSLNLIKTMKEDKTLAPPGLVKDYSTWMSQFTASKYAEDLELPGQYSGDCKPIPEYHIKIAGFDEKVLVMHSLRKPKRITVRGNNEKDYCLLVKCGEDLRQDQRIEQLFDVMNHVLQHDGGACGRSLSCLRTYRVIPMSTRLGVIEWMENVKTLKDFQMEALSDHEKTKAVESRRRYGEKYADPSAYLKHMSQYGVNDVTKILQTCEQLLPEDLLRRAMLQLSRSVESFFALKTNFIVSHAVMSCCHYLLGIGDRHLSNFMVDTTNGSLVGIDFGHAFGSATTLLRVPELMPFRLTCQLLNFLQPYGIEGLFTEAMAQVMRALRINCDLLLNTMDVFIKEPSLDWKENAKKQLTGVVQVVSQRRSSTKASSATSVCDEQQQLMGDTEWYPQQKIMFSRRKFKGDHPSAIMDDELKLNRAVSQCDDHRKRLLTSIVRGSESDRPRSKLERTGLTVEAQVHALIDQASDPNILGRTWVGWEPYF